MQNDAKLGLLVGSVGVLMAAVLMNPKAPALTPGTEAAAKPVAKTEKAPAALTARAAMPANPTPGIPTIPGSVSKPEVNGTPVKRIANRDR